MRPTRIIVPAFVAASLAFASFAAPIGQDPLDDDDRAYALELGRRTFEGNCLMCHTPEMVDGQRLIPEQWASEVDKMIGWGAPVPAEEKQGLIDYLVASYPNDGDAPNPARLTLSRAIVPTRAEPAPNPLPVGDPGRGGDLHAQHCATCHGTDGRGGDLGINLLARPVLHRPAEYGEILGKGRHRMPGFQFVLSTQEIADILAWLRSRSG